MNERYRAISWWLNWNDMMWPDQAIVDKIRRRADLAAEASVNCAMIFGMHFRWDHMPLWDRLHDLLAYTVEELHARKIAGIRPSFLSPGASPAHPGGCLGHLPP